MSDVAVREGDPSELVTVMRILDAGLLETEASEVQTRLDAGACLVAETSDRVVGVLVLDGDYVEAVAVAPSRRGRGIGTALVEGALDRQGRLVAEFDAAVRPFYESLGFAITPAENDESHDRFRGTIGENYGPS